MIPLRLYLYVGLALAALGLGAWAYHAIEAKGYARGIAKLDAHLSQDVAAELAAEQAARAAQQRHAQELADIAARYEQDKRDAQDKADRVIADLRSGALRLRSQWQGCQATRNLSGAVARAAEPDGGADLRRAGIGSVLGITGACQAQVKGLQEVVRADRR